MLMGRKGNLGGPLSNGPSPQSLRPAGFIGKFLFIITQMAGKVNGRPALIFMGLREKQAENGNSCNYSVIVRTGFECYNSQNWIQMGPEKREQNRPFLGPAWRGT